MIVYVGRRTANRRICAVGSLRMIAYTTDKLKIRRVAVSNYALLVGSHRYTVLQKASKRNGLRWVGCRGFCADFVLCLLFDCRKIVA